MSAAVCLMWKEYRVLRGFWLALAIPGLVCDGLIFLLVASPQERLPGLLGLAGVLPVCFALGAGATLFALEREESTRELLQYLPLTSLRIFASKIVVALSGTLLLTLVLLCARFAFADATGGQLDRDALAIAAACAVVALQVMGWSVFFSLRSARPLLAAVLGTLGALVCIGAVHVAGLAYGCVACGHVAAIALIWLVDVRCASTWLHGRRVALKRRQRGTPAPMPLKRLLWQEWRRSRRLLAALFALGVLLPAVQWTDPYSGGAGVVPAVGFVFALLGSCVFLGDQERLQFRFFADRGVSGRRVWFSRLLFWIGSASVLAATLLVAHRLAVRRLSGWVNSAAWTNAEFALSWLAAHVGPPATAPREWTIGWLTGLCGYIVWLALAFGSGQLCSMFFRSGLLAAVAGVILAGMLLTWATLMYFLSIGWWWSVAPLAAALFAATWVRADGWVLERRGFWAWLPSLLVLIVPAAFVLAGVPVYRVLEIPQTQLAQSPSRAQPPAGAEAKDAAGRLLRLCQQLPRPHAMDLESLSKEVPPEDQKWLTEHQSALDEVVEALSRLPADATPERMTSIAATTWQQTAAMLVRYGQVTENQGKLDEAWARYRAVLDLARLVRRGSTAQGEVLGDSIERAAVSRLIGWGAREGQTVERLRAAVSMLQQLDTQDELLADVVWREYEGNIERLNDVQAQPQRAGAIYEFAAKWAPWEFTRARRLLRYLAFWDVRDAGAADTAFVAATKPPVVSLRDADRAYVAAYASPLLQTTLLQQLNHIGGVIEARRSTLCYRRATQVALAAEWRRLKQGELPATLDELGQYFAPLRADPYTGQPFLWFPWGLRLNVHSKNVSEIPARTPLLYSPAKASLGPSDRDQLEVLRRRSADDSTWWNESINPGTSGGASAPGGVPAGGPPAGIGLPPGAAEETPPTARPRVDVEPRLMCLGGLAFPIPGVENRVLPRQ